ncbi:MAG TPA: histidine kinase dimerization/phospho-acceptor domain-containing protein, partial [Planctomicrobium sp.]|nr:histidine kinase dimerization/phospho-acceptor domain-containing protein [Planctomicrobium sp.]
MPPLTFPRRVAIALGVLLLVCFLTSPLLLWWWGGTLTALILQIGTAWMLKNWLCRNVHENCQDFQHVFEDLRRNLTTGERGRLLKSLRSDDAFGKLAQEINELVEQAATQVSLQLQTIQELEQNKALFKSILGTMAEGVLVLDSQRQVLYFNETARKMLDCSTRNFVGRPVWEVVRTPALMSIVDSAFASDQPLRRELELSRSKSCVDVSASRLRLHASPGVLLVLHDVTEVRRLEQMRREFVSNVSHELKTPLTSIQLYADTLMDDIGENDENVRLFLSRILGQTERLQELIQDMLRLARIESHSDAFELTPVSIQSVLAAAVESRKTLAASKQIELVLNQLTSDCEVIADTDGLQTAFENLVGNAILYTPEKGTVRIRARQTEEQIEISVEDNGIGIAAEHLGRIFERFYRVDKARTGG